MFKRFFENIDYEKLDEKEFIKEGEQTKSNERIRKIAKKHQVIAVTHQAILTAKANHNFMVKKVTDNLTTKTVVKNLTEEEIINEIARISGGSITKTAIEHAKELRKTA